jgi:hypothetical protein
VKSNKQRRVEILARRQKRAESSAVRELHDPRHVEPGSDVVLCNASLLAAYNSYGSPAFVARGYYVDMPFECADCGRQEVWRATQQKWWYEIAKGNVESRATRCSACRRVERTRQAEARRVHLEGVAKKRASKSAVNEPRSRVVE